MKNQATQTEATKMNENNYLKEASFLKYSSLTLFNLALICLRNNWSYAFYAKFRILFEYCKHLPHNIPLQLQVNASETVL